jgi:23S rRNA G2445 N2-methylase RlmL
MDINMNDKNKEPKKRLQSYFASCPLRLEDFLETELKTQSVFEIQKVHGGVKFKCDELSVLRVLHFTRIASRIFKLLDVYPINNQEDLYKKVKNKWWHKVFDLDQTFKITTLLDPDAAKIFKNSLHLSRVIKDGMVDQYREEKGERPNVNTDNPDLPFLARIEGRGKKDGFNAFIYLDICGKPLSDRGYRLSGHAAPLRENLAAAMVYQTNWDKHENFFDPMCGTGTIIIEACAIKMGLPPSYLKILKAVDSTEKPYAYQKQNWYKENNDIIIPHQKWLVEQADDIEVKLGKKPSNIFASDIRIDKIKKSLQAAKLNYCIQLAKADATEIDAFGETGIVICNPPYGERLGTEDETKELYYQFGQNIKQNFGGHKVFVLSLQKGPIGNIHLKTKRKTPFLNGQLDCRLFEYEINPKD